MTLHRFMYLYIKTMTSCYQNFILLALACLHKSAGRAIVLPCVGVGIPRCFLCVEVFQSLIFT